MFQSKLGKCVQLSKIPIRRLETLVSTKWLADSLGSEKNFAVVHASWDGCKDYNTVHIPSSICFDGQQCRDRTSPYSNMLPKPEEFAQYVGTKLGIDNNTDVIVYDSNDSTPIYATRVWYMFRVFGHDRVGVLDGGMKKWKEEKRDTTDSVTQVSPSSFTPHFRPDLVLSYEDVMEKVAKQGRIQLVDARSQARYKGIGEDPFGKPGHVPHAVNIPYPSFFDSNTKLFRDKQILEKLYREAGVDLSSPLATSCGTGMSATAVAFTSFLLGKTNVPVYDGSWCEWAKRAPSEYIVKE